MTTTTDPKVINAASAKKQFKEFEQNVSLPLTTDPYFKEFKQECKDPKNQIRFLTYDAHRILRELYQKSSESTDDKWELLDVIYNLSAAATHNYDLAIVGSFLQEAFLVIRDNICLCHVNPLLDGVRDSLGNYKVQERAQKPFYDKSYKLQALIEENIPFLKIWLQIAINFLKNPSVAEYSLKSDYLLFDYSLAFLTKSEDSDFVIDNRTREELKSLFYSLLEVCFRYPKMCHVFFDNPVLTYWFLELIDGCKSFPDYAKAYKLFGLLAKSDKLPATSGDKDIISRYVFAPMTKVVFPSERNSWEKNFLQKEEEIIDFAKTAAQLLYTLASKKSNMKPLLNSIRSFHTDILLRFYVTCLQTRDHSCIIHMTFAILNILKSDAYKFPSFAARLGVYLVSVIVGKDDFLLILLLRILKYINFSKIQKVCIFKMLLSSDTSQSLEISLQQIDDSILRKNLQENEDPEDIDPLRDELERKAKSATWRLGTKKDKKALFDHTFDEDSEDEEDEVSKTKIDNESDDLYKAILKQQKDDLTSLQDHSNNKDTEFYYKRRKNPNDMVARRMKYPFINDKGECFNFIKHCDSLCPFCASARGLFSKSDDELREYCFKALKKNQVVSVANPADLSLAIFQAVFDSTLDDSISFLYRTVVPHFCKFLLSDGIPIKYKFPILLYFIHLILNFNKGAQILYGVSFLLFAEDFISDFLVVFDLESFRKWRETKLVKVLVPKKQQKQIASSTKPTQNQSSPTKGAGPSSNNRGKPPLGRSSTKRVPTNEDQEEGGLFDYNPPEEKGRKTSIVGLNGSILGDLDSSTLNLDMEEVEVNGVDFLAWNKERNCFIYEDKVVDENDEEEVVRDKEDCLTDDGKYSKYFWRLHFMHHCLRVVLEMARTKSKFLQRIVEAQLQDAIEQMKEITIIFYKYSEKYIPTLPFHEDTECWAEIKNLLFETLGTVQEIQYTLASNFPKFASDFLRMTNNCPEILNIYIKLVGRLPTLSGSIALVSCLSLYYNYETVYSLQGLLQEDIEKNNADLFNNLAKEFQRLEGGMTSALKQDNGLQYIRKKNEKVIINALKFSLNALNVLNHLAIKNRIRVENLDTKTMETFFKSFTSVLKSIKTFMLEVVNPGLEAVDPKTSKVDDASNSDESDIEKLYHEFLLNTGVFLWRYSAHKAANVPMLKSGMLSFSLRDLGNMKLNQDTFFSFMASCHNLCQYSGDLNNISKYYDKFSTDIITFLTHCNKAYRPALIPLLRGLKILLSQNPQDRVYFKELGGFLGEIVLYRYSEFESPVRTKFDREEDEVDEFAKVMAEKQVRLSKILKVQSKQAEDKTKKESKTKFEVKQIKLLKKEAKDLLDILEVGLKTGLQQPKKQQQQYYDPRQDVIPGAGMLSNNTLRILYEEQKRKERMENQQRSYRAHDSNMADYSVLNLGNSLPVIPRGVSLEPAQRSTNLKQSMYTNVDSFNMSREAAGPPSRFRQDEAIYRFKKEAQDKQLAAMRRHSSQKSLYGNEMIGQIVPPNTYRQFEGFDYNYYKNNNNINNVNNRYLNPNVLRNNGRNILKNIDDEYQRLLMKDKYQGKYAF